MFNLIPGSKKRLKSRPMSGQQFETSILMAKGTQMREKICIKNYH